MIIDTLFFFFKSISISEKTGTRINNSSENNTEQTASVEHVLLNCKDCFSRLELNTSKILTYSKKIYQSWQSSLIT